MCLLSECFIQVSILSLLDIAGENQLEQELEALFGTLHQQSPDKSKSYDRIKAIDTVYRLFLKQIKTIVRLVQC